MGNFGCMACYASQIIGLPGEFDMSQKQKESPERIKFVPCTYNHTRWTEDIWQKSKVQNYFDIP